MPLFKRKTEVPPKTISSSLWQSETQPDPAIIPNGTIYSGPNVSSLQEESPTVLLSKAEENFNPASPMRTKSRLSKTLQEVLSDHGALAYFIQFMEAQGAKHLIKFWLETESFLVSVRTRLRDKSECKQCALLDSDVNISSPNDSKVSGKSEVFRSGEQQLTHATEYSREQNSELHSHRGLDEQDEEFRSYRDNSKGEKSLLLQSCSENVLPFLDESQHLRVLENNVNNRTDGTSGSVSNTNNSPVNNVNNGHDLLSSSVHLQEKDETLKNSVEKLCEQLEVHRTWNNYEEKSKDPSLNQNNTFSLAKSIRQDAMHIVSKYIAQDASYSVDLPSDMRSKILDSVSKEDCEVNPDRFALAQKYVEGKMDAEYFPTFLRSTFHCKHQIDVLTSGSVYLADVLYNDAALFYFMEYMEQEGVRHLVDFLLMADNFHNQLMLEKEYDAVQAQDDAMVLYDKYFSLQATSSLGFSDRIRFEIEQNICQAEGPSPDCFLKPVTILMQHLEKTYLPQFLTSQLYFKYLSECINTIQNGCDLFSPRKRSGSESSSSEHSVSTQQHLTNTLLAMDSKQPGVPVRKILKNIEDQDMRIDTGQFHPDALWKRQLAGKLQMAHVDQFGKLTSEFQPEPDRKTGSRLSKAVKKLVNWEEDKTQEDMAWQVAEMIVKDICDITMGSGAKVKKENNENSRVS